jgi:hypothetical protein
MNTAVDAPDSYLAGRAAIDMVWASAVSRHNDRFGITGQHGDSVGLDKSVEYESASGLPLAIAAMTAMHEHRQRDEPIAHSGTGASALQILTHLLPPVIAESIVAGQGLRPKPRRHQLIRQAPTPTYRASIWPVSIGVSSAISATGINTLQFL